MVIESISGIKVATRRNSPVTFEKIEKRWYLMYYVKNTRGKEPCRIPVKRVFRVKGGTIR